MSEPGISADEYRAVMRQWPSGVTVVTMTADGQPHGMTASAFTSVSIHPPLVLVVVDQRWRSHGYLFEAGAFCVNILADDQQALSDRFAGRHGEVPDRFAEVAVGVGQSGSPVLLDALGYLDCTVEHTFPTGDHTIFVGRVVACGVRERPGSPLIYHHTRYAQLAS